MRRVFRRQSAGSLAAGAPPPTIAPAWPIRFPGGAVRPAMKANRGLDIFFFKEQRGLFFRRPPNFADHEHRIGPGILFKKFQHIDEVRPLIGSPRSPPPWTGRPRWDSCHTASYVSVPDRETTPMRPGLWMYPGMIPILHPGRSKFPGVMTPGPLGPIKRTPVPFKTAMTRAISNTGIPSVTHGIEHECLRRPLPKWRRRRKGAGRNSEAVAPPPSRPLSPY